MFPLSDTSVSIPIEEDTIQYKVERNTQHTISYPPVYKSPIQGDTTQRRQRQKYTTHKTENTHCKSNVQSRKLCCQWKVKKNAVSVYNIWTIQRVQHSATVCKSTLLQYIMLSNSAAPQSAFHALSTQYSGIE